MDAANDLLKQVAAAPPWAQIFLALTFLSLIWKKSQLPNKWLPLMNLVLPTALYPLLQGPGSADPGVHHPLIALGFQGFLTGGAAEVFHDGIVRKLQGYFPGIKFPPDTSTPPPPNAGAAVQPSKP